PVVQRTEVAVPVDQGDPHREVLAEPDQRVVDRGVAVRVKLAHDLADDTRRLHVAAIGSQTHFGHLIYDAPLHRFQPVARVREGTGVDDRVGVFEIGRLHLVRYIDVDDRARRIRLVAHACIQSPSCGYVY